MDINLFSNISVQYFSCKNSIKRSNFYRRLHLGLVLKPKIVFLSETKASENSQAFVFIFI